MMPIWKSWKCGRDRSKCRDPRFIRERLPLEDKHDYNGNCFHHLDRAIFLAEEMARTNYENQLRKGDTFDLAADCGFTQISYKPERFCTNSAKRGSANATLPYASALTIPRFFKRTR